MRPLTKTLLSHIFALTWISLALILFTLYTGRISYVQSFYLQDVQSILGKIGRIEPFTYARDILYAFAGVILFSLACLALGLQILRSLTKQTRFDWALGATGFVVGEILFSLIFLTTISAYQLKPALVAVYVLMGFLVGVPALKSFFNAPPRWQIPKDFNKSEKFALWLAVIVFVLGVLYSSTRLGYDAVAEYFSHAKIMAVSGQAVFFYPSDSFVVSSFHPGILFTAIIQLFGDQAARMLPWLNGLAIMLLGLSIATETGLTVRARLGFTIMMLTSTAFVDLLGEGKVELISTAPILAAVYWMLLSTQRPSKGIFALIGLLAGFAMISRPYNAFLVSVFGVLFYLSQFYAQSKAGPIDIKSFIRSAVWFVPPILALGIFHLLANWFFLGSPFAPLTYARSLNADAWQWQFNPADLYLYRLLYPFTVSFLNTPQSLGNISPLFIAFLPFALSGDARRKLNLLPDLWRLTISALLTILAWITLFFTVVEVRYVLFLWVLLYLPMSQILESTTQNLWGLFRPLINIIMIALLAYIGARTILIAIDTYSPIDTQGNAHCEGMLYCDFIKPVNQLARPGDRVLALNSYRYYLRSDLFACSSRVDEYINLAELARQNPSAFWVEAYKQNYRYIIFEKHLSEQRFLFGSLPDPNSAPDWVDIRLLYSEPLKSQSIYLIETIAPPIQPVVYCERDTHGIWQVTVTPTPQP